MTAIPAIMWCRTALCCGWLERDSPSDSAEVSCSIGGGHTTHAHLMAGSSSDLRLRPSNKMGTQSYNKKKPNPANNRMTLKKHFKTHMRL